MTTSNANNTMRGVQLIGHGGPEMLQVRHDLPVPSPKPGEVLVKIAAAGVNNTDVNTRIGWYSKNDGDSADASWAGDALQLPRIQGADVCGEIVAVGSEVDAKRIGERVMIEPCLTEVNEQALEHFAYFGSECDGGFAEYAVVAAKHAFKVESKLSDIELASFPCSYSTAENLLTRARLKAGERVLVTGASGGVGSAAVQLAKARSAEVIAVTSASKQQQLIDLGADQCVARGDSLLEALGSNSVDVVIDLVAGEQWPELLELMRPLGRYAVAGAIGGPHVNLDVRTLYLKDLSFFGCTKLEPEVFGNLVALIEQGKIKPLVAATFPLEQITQAQQVFQEKGHTGKIVLKVAK